MILGENRMEKEAIPALLWPKYSKKWLKMAFLRSFRTKSMDLRRFVEFFLQIKAVEDHFTYGGTVSKPQTKAELVLVGRRTTKMVKNAPKWSFLDCFRMKTVDLRRFVEFSPQIKAVGDRFTYGGTSPTLQMASEMVPVGPGAT
jgi:hypothetical protein